MKTAGKYQNNVINYIDVCHKEPYNEDKQKIRSV